MHQLNFRFTNFTTISGDPTLEPEDMYDQTYTGKKNKKNPWSSPGSAPIVGDGCGVNGGNPDGCIGMRKFYLIFFPRVYNTNLSDSKCLQNLKGFKNLHDSSVYLFVIV